MVQSKQIPPPETFFGSGWDNSGIEIPAHDADFYAPKDVPHGDVRERWYFSKVLWAELKRLRQRSPISTTSHTWAASAEAAAAEIPISIRRRVAAERSPDPAAFNKKVKLLFLGIGSAEGPGTKNFSDALTNAGIHTVYFESPGTAHEWLTWRRCLNDFAPRLFR